MPGKWFGFWAIASFAAVVVCGACGPSTTPAPRVPEPPEALTRATLVGPRCASGLSCTCREPGADAADSEGSPPAPPYKRFEVRVGPHPNDLWVTVADNVLYKSRERGVECFYLDLVPGKHPVTVRGRGEGGVAAVVAISERSAGGPWWYPTFFFDCGQGGVCDAEGYEVWKAGLSAFSRNLHAPCGSTKIRNIQWQTGRMPDGLHPSDIELRLLLDVYEFETSEAPGQCKGAKRDGREAGGGSDAAGQPPTDEPADGDEPKPDSDADDSDDDFSPDL